MTTKKIGIIVFLLCFCLYWMPNQAMAASTSEAVEPIIPDQACSLTVSYCYGETAFSGLQVKLFRIADVSADFQYTLTQNFSATGLRLNGIQASGEWNVIRSTLEAHILADTMAPDFTAVTNADGQANFEALKTGMYLAIVGQAEQDTVRCRFDSALITLPGLEPDGRWQYAASVNAKGEVLPPAEPDKTIEHKVLKLWRGDEGGKSRPESIEVEIFRDGVSYKTTTLSEDNHWAYSWSAPDDGASWTVIERNAPQGYTMTVEERQGTFVLTNTWTPAEPEDPVKPPQTGDTFNPLPYVLLMVGSGCMLIILGVIGKKSHL